LLATPLFDENPYRGLRRVINISGDGPNNDGPPVTPVRDQALAKGIVINGLPVMMREPSYSTMEINNLDWYYEDCVMAVQARLSCLSRTGKISKRRARS
jgi:hypothetical protein